MSDRRYTDADIRDALRAVAELVGRPPTLMEYREYRPEGAPSTTAIQRAFDSERSPWLAALEWAGLEPDARRHGGGPASKQDCKRALRLAAAELAEWPSPDQYRELGMSPSVATIYDRYGDWQSAREAAQRGQSVIGTLIEDGPGAISLADVTRQRYGIRRASVESYSAGSSATVYYLPGHEPGEVAAALYEELSESQRDALSPKKVSHLELREDVRSALRRLVGRADD